MVVLFLLKVRAVSEVDGNVPPGRDTGAETPVTNTARVTVWARDPLCNASVYSYGSSSTVLQREILQKRVRRAWVRVLPQAQAPVPLAPAELAVRLRRARRGCEHRRAADSVTLTSEREQTRPDAEGKAIR